MNFFHKLWSSLAPKSTNQTIITICLLIEALVAISLCIYYLCTLPFAIATISCIFLILLFSSNLYIILKISKLNILLLAEKEHTKSLSLLYDNVKGFKHDFDNITNTIGGFIKNNDLEGLKKYYYSLNIEFNKINTLEFLSPTLINNPGIYCLLNSKYFRAKDFNVHINLEFFVNLNDFRINMYEFSRILGILIDNAIEAAKDSEEKIINLKFRNELANNRHIVIIENSYKNKDVNVDEIFDKGKTGKQNHSGLGLYEVRNYIKKANNLNLFTSKNDKYFIQQLEIYYPATELSKNVISL